MDKNDLYELFFTAVFEKAKQESLKEKKTPQADHIADVVFAGKEGSAKTLLRLYNKYVSKTEPDNAGPKVELRDTLAGYLGYENFIAYSNHISGIKTESEEKKPEQSTNKDNTSKPEDDPPKVEESTEQTDQEKREVIRKRMAEINRGEKAKIISADSEKKKIESKKERIKKKEKPIELAPHSVSKRTKQNGVSQGQITATKPQDKKRKKRLIWVLFLLVIISVSYLIYFFNFGGEKTTETETQICVAWQDDHYVKIDCETARNNPKRYESVTELEDVSDFENYKNKRKIEIYSNSIVFNEFGQTLVWYYHNGNDYEFFNFSGNHPTKSVKLLPMTLELLNSYLGISEADKMLAEAQDSVYYLPLEEDDMIVQKPCELNLTGAYNFVNQTNGTLKISTKIYGTNEGGEVLFVGSKQAFQVSNVPAGHIQYTAYLNERNLFLRQSDFWVPVCDTQRIEFSGNYELEENVAVKPSCETNQTGDFSFRNKGSDGIRIRITKKGSRAFKDQEITLAGKELKWLRDLPTQDYSYSVYTTATNNLILRGSFTIVQCGEGKQVIEGGLGGGTETAGGNNSSEDCETKKLGDYCFTNNWSKAMHVRIGFSTPGSPLTSFFREMDILSGATECFLDQPVGAYNVYYYPVEVSARTLNHHRNTQIRIVACQAGKMQLNF